MYTTIQQQICRGEHLNAKRSRVECILLPVFKQAVFLKALEISLFGIPAPL